MSARIVTEDVSFLWDGVTQRLTRGQMLDVVPDSALEAAIGADNLRPPGPIAAAPPAAPEPPAKPAPAAVKPDEGKQEEAPETAPKKKAAPVTEVSADLKGEAS